jgi:hypothetical protein
LLPVFMVHQSKKKGSHMKGMEWMGGEGRHGSFDKCFRWLSIQ